MEFKETSRSELIEKYLMDKIIGSLAPDSRIPSERVLAKELGVALPTVNKILVSLTDRGILYRKRGAGTYVAGPRLKGKVVRIVTESPSLYNPESSVNWFNCQFVLEGFSEKARKSGVITEPFFSTYAWDLSRNMDEVLDSSVSGYVFHLYPEAERFREQLSLLAKRNIIVIARSFEASGFCHTVYGGMREGVKSAVSYLLRKGRRKIACLELMDGFDGYVNERICGFREAHKEAGLPVDESIFRHCGSRSEDACAEIRKMLDESVYFDAVFAGTDVRAYGVLNALREAGVKVPDDVAVIGSDDLPQSRILPVPLGTVRYPMHEIGAAICDVFSESFKNPGCPLINRKIDCEFIPRESCG